MAACGLHRSKAHPESMRLLDRGGQSRYLPGVTSPEHNVSSWIRDHAATDPERLAVVDGELRLTYAALEARVGQAAAWLRSQGLGPGDRIALLLANRSAYLELVFAAARLGAIAMPINTRLAAPEISQLLDDARPLGLVHEEELTGLAEGAVDGSREAPWRLPVGGTPDVYEASMALHEPLREITPVEPETPMILMYTSGTTGTPKGALLPHRKTLFNSKNAERFFGCGRADRVLVVVPLFHSFGLAILSIPALYVGATIILQRHFEPVALWQTVEREQVTYFGGVPTMFRGLRDALDTEKPNIPALRFLFTAGAAIPVELIHDFEERGLRLKQGFGQTETSILCCLDAADAIRKAGSVGRPVHHGDVRIIRVASLEHPPDQWEPCEPGEDGEIVVRGEINMLGYWERPEATAETLRDDWLRTGDLGSVDDEGFVTLTGRARDMYISGGENVYPRQVEAVLETHPLIREIAVVGVPHERWGETGRAYLALEPGAKLATDALKAWARERLAAFKVPTEFQLVPELPKTVTGKVQKFLLPDLPE